MKESKRSHFENYFKNNLSHLQSTWKGIKNLITLKELANVDTSNFFYNGRCLTESKAIANAFNKYFVNVATDIQFFIRYSNNNFHDLFHPIRINCFWSTPLIKLKSKI